MSRAADVVSSSRGFRDGLVFQFLEKEIYPIRILNKESRDSTTYQFHNRSRHLLPYLHEPGIVLKDGQWFTLIFNKEMHTALELEIKEAKARKRHFLDELLMEEMSDLDREQLQNDEFTKLNRDEAILEFLHKRVFQYINSRFYISYIELSEDRILITFVCNKVSRSSKKSVIDIEYVRKNINKALSELNKYYMYGGHFELLDVLQEVDIRKMGKKTKKHKTTRRLTTKKH